MSDPAPTTNTAPAPTATAPAPAPTTPKSDEKKKTTGSAKKGEKVEVSADKKATGKPPSRLTTAAKAKPTDKKIE